MANNGYFHGGQCLQSAYYAEQYCRSLYGASFTASFDIIRPGGIHNLNCVYLESGISKYRGESAFPVPGCEIPGPALTEIEQIDAINAMFPAAVAILATAWAFKWLRNMVYEWLKERNQND